MAATPNEQVDNQNVTLRWRGPLKIPRLTVGAGAAVSDLQSPHVYFYIQKYPEAEQPHHEVVYVGRASDFLKRMFEHYRYFLGFGYWLRNESGQYIYKVEPEAQLRKLDNIDQSIHEAINEIKRINFFCASCPGQNLNAVESALINCVKDRAENNPGIGLQCDNSRREWHGWYDKILAIKHETHEDFPEAGKYLDLVFGTREMRWGGGRD